MRKAKPKKRYVLPDPKFRDVVVTKFVNNLMYRWQEKYCLQYFLRCIRTSRKTYKRKWLRALEKSIEQCITSSRG